MWGKPKMGGGEFLSEYWRFLKKKIGGENQQ